MNPEYLVKALEAEYDRTTDPDARKAVKAQLERAKKLPIPKPQGTLGQVKLDRKGAIRAALAKELKEHPENKEAIQSQLDRLDSDGPTLERAIIGARGVQQAVSQTDPEG
jgi:hypothetical protein